MAAVLDMSKWTGNVEKYLRDTQRMNQADAASEKASKRGAKAKTDYADAMKRALDPAQKLTGSVTQLLGSVGALPSGLGAAVGGLDSLGSGAVGALEGLSALGISVSSTTLLLGAAAVAAVAASAAFVALGLRGAAMPGVIQAFDITSAKAGVLSATLLGDLRAASRGTVSDLALMKSANLALAGASDEVARTLGPGGGLAGLMNVARAQARATGQDVDFLFQSLVSGVKRSSPMLIDNTGLVLKVGDANEKMAQSLGKSVEQLTAAEKQIAILNATLEAGKDAVETYGSGPLQAAERIAQIQTQISNLLDRAALSIQPIFNFILAIGQTLLSVVIYPIQNILLPIIYAVSNAIFGPLTSAWEGLTGLLSSTFAPVLNLIHRWLTLVIGVVRALGTAFQWVVRQIGNVLKPVADIVKATVVEPIAKLLDPAAFAKAGGAVFGAFAQGIMAAANTLIFPTVIAIAQFIRDFLMGFSPPKEGPLSTIDQGGYNVMAAWMEGFTGVPLTPVKEMAAQVDAELGSIGQYSYQAVQARLAALDAALQPFVDHLEIAKAKMDAIVEPLQEAQDAIRDRLDKTVQAFMAGDASAGAVRALDRQNEALSEQIGLYEDVSDEAQYQLSMAKARQAVERALLTVQQRRVQPEETATATTTAAIKTASAQDAGGVEEAASGGGGSSDLEEAAGGGGGNWEDLTQEDPSGSFLGVTDEDISALWGDITGGFAEGFDFTTADGTVADFQANIDTLQSTLGEIDETSGFQKLKNTFDSVFGDGEDSLKTKVSNFVTDVTTFFSEDIPAVLDAFSLDSLTGTFESALGASKESVRSKISGFVTFASEKFSVGGVLDLLFGGFSLAGLTTLFTDTFGTDDAGLRGAVKGFGDKVTAWFAAGGTLQVAFEALSLVNVKDKFDNMFGPDGVIVGFFGDVKDAFTGLFKWEAGGSFFDLVSTMAASFDGTFLAPIRGVFNALIGVVWGAIGQIAGLWNSLLGTVVSANEGWFGDAFIPDDIPDFLNKLKFDVGEAPVIGAKTGGFFAGGGLAKVHQGEVLAQAAGPFSVFPARWVSAMETLADRMSYAPPPSTSAEPVVIDAGGLNVTQTFHGRTDAAAMKRTLYELNALGVL
ncbi:hypothetical protein [Aggregatilinea lenta]|uniref:hypothetical protein n=1 Tax=Aggregatilinea lenta TaxID=913108 RepID=UPI000E5B794A|nr:hypothetical protein [Aggregatilinea lenta]